MSNKAIYLTFVLTLVVAFGIKEVTYVGCTQIGIFQSDLPHLIFQLLIRVILGIVIWIIGYKIFKKLSLKKIPSLIYFILLSTLLSAILIFNPRPTKALIQSICEKSEDNGMMYEANKLTVAEYHFLIEGAIGLPKSPPKAEHINIYYYRDGFLPDYSLSIQMKMPKNEKLDSLAYPGWKKVNDREFEFYEYED